jgi:hypothetical protein
MTTTVVSPHPELFLDRLVEQVTVCSVLRRVITLAEQAPALTDSQVRARLSGLAAAAWVGCRECGSRSDYGAPAAHCSSVSPGGQPVPDPGALAVPCEGTSR